MKSEMAGKTRHEGKNFFCRCGRSQQSVQAVMRAVRTFWAGSRPSQLEKGTCPRFGSCHFRIFIRLCRRLRHKVNTEGAFRLRFTQLQRLALASNDENRRHAVQYSRFHKHPDFNSCKSLDCIRPSEQVTQRPVPAGLCFEGCAELRVPARTPQKHNHHLCNSKSQRSAKISFHQCEAKTNAGPYSR